MILDRDPQVGPRVAIEVTETAVRARTEDGIRDAGQFDVRSAVAALDDDLALLPGRVVPSRALWAALFESLITERNVPVRLDSMTLIHPTSWSPGRRTLLSNAARMMAATVTMRSRAFALAERGVRADLSGRAFVVVEVSPGEIAVIVVGHGSTGEPTWAIRHLEERPWETSGVADVARAVARAVEDIVRNERSGVATILVDSADDEMGEAIIDAVDRLGLAPGVSQVAEDSVFRDVYSPPRMSTFVDEPADEPDVHAAPEWTPAVPARSTPRLPRWWPAAAIGLAAAIVVTGVVLTIAATRERQPPPPSVAAPTMATSLLVEGRVQLMVPAEWAVRRIPAGGAGSARVEVISPEDPEVMVHVTQVRVRSSETLASTAETLRAAMEKEPSGAFTDFKADDSKMGRPAVTYTEVREGHDIAWTVLLDKELRIGVGCQFKNGSYMSVRQSCEMAIRTAHAVVSGS